MTRKRIIIHIGFYKTGSTALQTYFSANTEALEDVGVSYPYREPDHVVAHYVCTGNIVRMLRHEFPMTFLRGRLTGNWSAPRILWNIPSKAFCERIAAAAEQARCDIVLFSGEIMGKMPPKHLRHLKSIVGGRHELIIVAFARDPYDYCQSAWKQVVKGSARFKEPLGRYVDRLLKRQGIPIMAGFERYRDAGLTPIMLNYDAYKKDIVGAFFEAAGIPRPPRAKLELSGKDFNPSLTTSEALLVQKANAALSGSSFPATIRRYLLKRDPRDRIGTPFYSREVHQQILDRYQPTIEAINQVILGGPLSTNLRDLRSTKQEILDGDIDALIQAMKETITRRQPSSNGGLATRLRTAVEKTLCPSDFDPEAYLFHNEDAAASRLDPYLHYALLGRLKGRPYKYL